jgi:hypothetical protein
MPLKLPLSIEARLALDHTLYLSFHARALPFLGARWWSIDRDSQARSFDIRTPSETTRAFGASILTAARLGKKSGRKRARSIGEAV